MSTETMASEVLRVFRDNEDFSHQSIRSGERTAELFYIPSVCDPKKIQQDWIEAFFKQHTVGETRDYLTSLPRCRPVPATVQAIQSAMQRGELLIRFEGQAFLWDVSHDLNTKPLDAVVETTIMGPQTAFSEHNQSNLNIIRKLYPNPELKIQSFEIGAKSRTPVSLIYDETLAKPEIVQEIVKKLTAARMDTLLSVGQLQKILSDQDRTLIPTMMITERPDRLIYNLAKGKLAILVEGTPFCLIMPAVFFDFFSSMDDVYSPFWIARPVQFLRYMGLAITLTAPALYIAVSSFNPEIVRVQLALSLAGSRAAVPYPSYIEVLFMMFMVEALVEASIRLPKYIGATATTVGGLILGQAAQQAGLVSSVMIIVTSAVAISNFVIPINVMSWAIRSAKYILILLTTIFGFIGLTLGIIGFAVYICDQRSFGRPFFAIFQSERMPDQRKPNGVKR